MSLSRKPTRGGSNDPLIAPHAMALGRVLVTANAREFYRVNGLVRENWLS
jgi:tRNA(fMet)-specific endonuclease VapC